MKTNKICPIKELAAAVTFSILGASNHTTNYVAAMSKEDCIQTTYCSKEDCAWYIMTKVKVVVL